MAARGLGKGLDALIPSAVNEKSKKNETKNQDNKDENQ